MTRHPRRRDPMEFLLVAITTATLWVLAPGGGAPAWAEPVIAVRTGYSCGQCHVNRGGGGMRTAFGSLYSQTVLPSRPLTWRDRGYLLSADPDARFAYGGDLRAAYSHISSDDYDNVSTFEIPPSSLYGQFRFVPGRLFAYVDQRVGSGASSSRELFGLLASRSGDSYVKFGKFFPAFGWMLADDDAFIRETLGFAFSAPDIGLEAGFEPGKWSTHMSVVNGNAGSVDADDEKKYTVTVARRFGTSKLGLSAANDISGDTSTTWAGLFGGVNFGRFSLLAEGDWRRTRPDDAPSQETWVTFFEANMLLKRGLIVRYAHDWIDPNRDLRDDRQQRDSLGVEYFPFPFVQIRVFARRKDGPRQVVGTRDRPLEFEVHLFF